MKNNIKYYRRVNNETQRDLAKLLHVTHQMIYKYENGLSTVPPDVWKTLSQHWAVSVDSLMGVHKTRKKYKLFESIAAGVPRASVLSTDELVDADIVIDDEHFALRVKGRSMEPRISDGDIVICRRQDTVENGQIAVVLVNGDEATLKMVKKSDKGITLIGYNTDVYPPHFYTAEECEKLPIRIVGRAVERRGAL